MQFYWGGVLLKSIIWGFKTPASPPYQLIIALVHSKNQCVPQVYIFFYFYVYQMKLYNIAFQDTILSRMDLLKYQQSFIERYINLLSPHFVESMISWLRSKCLSAYL